MKQRNFKIVSLLTVFTIVLNVLSALVLLSPAKAFDSTKDTMTVQTLSATSNHAFTFKGGAGITSYAIVIDFPTVDVLGGAHPFVNAGGVTASVTAGAAGTCQALALQVICTPATAWDWTGVGQTVTVVGLTNPNAAGSYAIGHKLSAYTGTIAGADLALTGTASDVGLINVPVVDSDTVNVTGYINTSIAFDIDTTTAGSTGIFQAHTGVGGADPIMCSPTTCLAYEGQLTTLPANYTVDLGNLVSGTANISDTSSVLHQDGGSGKINSIYLHLNTNAANGAVVTYQSANGALKRTQNVGAVDSYDIPSSPFATPDTFATVLGVAGHAYGIRQGAVPAFVNESPLNTNTTLSGCAAGDAAHFCSMPTTATQLFSVTSSVEGMRARYDLGAMSNGTNPAGTYNDTLTFIATATY
jgi:hypothetical protein